MPRSIGRAPTPVRIAAASLLAGLLMALSYAGPADAALSVSTDPLVTLSTGAVLDLSTHTLDLRNDLQNVNYVLHVPAGTSVTGVIYPDGSAAYTSLSWVADDVAGTYDAGIVVTTGQTATASAEFVVVSLPAGLQLPLAVAPVFGTTGQPMHIHLNLNL